MLTIHLFGHARLSVDGVIAPLRIPSKALQALAYLATHRESPVSREFLAAVLWPDDSSDAARANLRRHLHLLAGALPKTDPHLRYVVTTMKTARWNDAADVALDVATFEAAVLGNDSAEVVTLYGGDFLEGFDDDWILAERERYRALYVEQLQRSLHEHRSQRKLPDALADVRRILEVDPWREDMLRVEMLVRAQLGDRAGALSAYRDFERRLVDELDTEPTPETRAAFDAIVRGQGVSVEDATLAVARSNGCSVAVTLPFVGRDAELETLAAAWSSAARGSGTTVLLSGEAGAGKSRLCHELGLLVERQGGAVLLGTTSHGEDTPYEAVADALRCALPLLISLRTPAERGVLARILPEIEAQAEIREPPESGAVAERTRIFDAIASALQVLARRRPLLVILEDLHWATATSIALFEFLSRRVRSLPVLIVGTHREEAVGVTHPLRAARRRMETERALERVVLARFDRTIVGTIAASFCNGDDIESVTDALYRYSEGIPLFLDEALLGGGTNAQARRLNVPERMHKLSGPALALVEIAAVGGAGFNVDTLCEVAGWPEADVLQALDEVVEARLVRQGTRRRFGDYVFSHHLIHEAVYQSVAPDARRAHHMRTARVLERAYPDRDDRSAEVAMHYDRGGDRIRAAASYAVAAQRALDLYANDEALAHSARGIELSCEVETTIDLETSRAWAAQWLGRPEIVASALERLAALILPPARIAEFERLTTIAALGEGRFDDARRSARRFLRAARANGDADAVFQAHLENCAVAIARDRYDRASTHIRFAEAMLPLERETAALRLMRMKTWLLQRRGLTGAEMTNAAAWLLTESRRIGDPQTEAEAHLRLAHVAMADERFAEAFVHFDFAREAYRRFGSPRAIGTIDVNAGNAALWSADYTTAQMLYQRCLEFARDSNATSIELVSAIGLTLADIYCGKLPEARTTIDSVEHLARARRTHEGANWRLCRALIAAESGDYVPAADEYDAALALHRTLPPGVLYAVTLALATLTAFESGDRHRIDLLGDEVMRLPEALLDGEEFPHLMLWAKAHVARSRGDEQQFAACRAGALRLYRDRVRAIGAAHARAYEAVPWNARFREALQQR